MIIAKTKKDILNFPQESNYNSLRLIWRRGLRSPLFRRLSAGWGLHRSAMSLDLLASLSRPNVIREDLPKHHLVIIKINIQYNHRKEYRIKNRNVSGSSAWNSRTISAIQKGVYPSPLVSFHFPRSGTNPSPNSFESRPGFSPLTNYVTTTEQTWLTNMVYAPLM